MAVRVSKLVVSGPGVNKSGADCIQTPLLRIKIGELAVLFEAG
jgi:hypothetical protein